MLLIHKPCKFKKCSNKSISIYGSNKYCRNHTEKLCCMNSKNNIYNEKRCNSTVEMITLNDQIYCNAHYRTLISTCHHPSCNVERDSNYLSFDKYWYCEEHKPSKNIFISNMIHGFSQKGLYPELIYKICDIHLKSDSYFI